MAKVDIEGLTKQETELLIFDCLSTLGTEDKVSVVLNSFTELDELDALEAAAQQKREELEEGQEGDDEHEDEEDKD